MELLALLSNRDTVIINNVKETLKKYTVYPLKTVEELEELHNNIPLNLLLIDTVSHRLSSLNDLLNKFEEDIVVLITSEKLDEFSMDKLPASVYDCVETDSIRTELPIIVERALERQKFKSELNLLRQSRNGSATAHMPIYAKSDVEAFSSRFDSFPGGKYLQEKVFVNFAKMLTVSFDMRKLFNQFIDSVMEIARVNKMSVMLKDVEGFHVKTHFGLDPYIAENLRLGKDSPLISWLAKTGRIMHKPASPADSLSINIKKEMDLLQCSFAIPMIHKGKLIGVFNIDNKITEEPFYREELEIIYVLCNYLAAAVSDIELYHQMWYQKEFTTNILSSMNSGIIAIDRNEKITMFNQQASEILNLDADEMVGRDLRRLPSPFGDILYETMVTGNSYKRHEVEILSSKLPVGINSYRLLDEKKNSMGAGIVFSDLSDSKKLEKQLRRAEKVEAINSLMAKIAHEVRNPLTSIQTYVQLINEKYKDVELSKFYTSPVSQSLQKINSLIDKLVTFSNTSEYNFDKEDATFFIKEASDYVSKNIPEGYKFLLENFEGSVLISADRKILIKAIYYLIRNIVERSPEGTFITMSGKIIMTGPPSVEISIKWEGNEITEEEKKSLFKPLLDIDILENELNLPISNKIIEGHQGTLEIKSEDGSNFYIIKMPAIDRRTNSVTIKRGEINE